MQKYTSIFRYAFFYGICVSILSGVFLYLPWSISLENQLYDRIQSAVAIDSKEDWEYAAYAHWLEQLCFINLEASFFDKETDRLRPEKLAEVLEKIRPALENAKVVFVDYKYRAAADKDSSLYHAMSTLEEHLVLPFSMQVTGSIALRGKGSQLRKEQVNLGGGKSQIPAGVGGYTNPFEDPYTFSNRYYKYRLDDGSYYSVPYLIHDRVSDNPTLHLQKKGLTEIRFILRNNDIEMEDRAVPVYPAEMMLDGRMPLEAIKKATAHKLVFVGLFGNYETKHQQAIDKFLTPVTPRMSGTLLLVNAWLNLAAGGQVRSNPIWLFFVFNFIVAAIMGFWYQNRKGRHWGAVLTLFINLTISLGIFPLIGLILYISFGIKLALGMSLLLFQYHYQFYIFITEKRKIHDPTK